MPYRYETKRLDVLRALDILDTPPEAEFDIIVDMAKRISGCKIALISLVDADRQWFKAKCGLSASETSRDLAFCAHAVAADDILIVPDATLDPRFADNPLVTGEPFIRFYVGIPVRARPSPNGEALPLGTLCVIDDKPAIPGEDRIAPLQGLAKLVEALFEMRAISACSLSGELDRYDALVQIGRKQRQLSQAERMANVGSWRLDLSTDHVEWSDQVYAIHGLSPGDGQPLSTALDFYPPGAREQLAQALKHCIETGEAYDVELDFINARGELRRVHAIGEPEVIEGERVAIIGVIQDITERYRLEQTLLDSAQTDELTRIASRRSFNEHLDAAIDLARRDGNPLAVALIDLDRFKEVNDRLGHAAGDAVLRAMAQRLKSAAYLGDAFAARLGGDEFVLLLRGEDARHGLKAMLQKLLGDLQYIVGPADGAVTVSATIGLCQLAPGHDGRSALLQDADHALYSAKRFRRGTAAIFGMADAICPAPTTAMNSPLQLAG